MPSRLTFRAVRRPAAVVPLSLSLLIAGCGTGEDPGSQPGQQPPAQPRYQASITMTRHGVPHIKAEDFASLGFGVAIAYARENFCLLAEQIVTVSGERSLHFGSGGQALVSFVPISNLNSDLFYKSYLDDAALAQAYASTSMEVKDLLRGYVAGYNEYLAQAPVQGAPRNSCDGKPWVRPITEQDFMRLLGDKAVLASGAAFAQAIATAQPPAAGGAASPAFAARRLDRDVVLAQLNPYYTRGAASNAYAIGKGATHGASGMLLGNPHWPWFGSNQFFEVHMTVPGQFDVFGAMNGDAPLPLIGFNKDVAWTHTVSPTLRHSIYQLDLVPGDPLRYRVDGVVREMTQRVIAVKVRNDDGSVTTQTRTLYNSHLGPILQVDSLVPGGVNLRWTSANAYTLRDANLNSLRLLEQWLRIGQARNVSDIKAALVSVNAIPYVHTIAADRDGQALYADVGATPNLSKEQLTPGAGSCVKGASAQAVLSLVNVPILDGSRAACDWANEAGAVRPGLMPPVRLPVVQREDYVASSNQSAWFVHPAARIDDLSPLLGGAGGVMTLRQRLAFRQIDQRLAGSDGLPGKGFGSLDDMASMLFGHRLMAAELTVNAPGQPALPTSLADVCLPEPGQPTRVANSSAGRAVDLGVACGLLNQSWDRRATLTSKGAVLFREFWRRLRMPAGTPLWLVPFNPADPLNTPRDLNTTPGPALDTLRRTLADTVEDLAAKGVDISRPLGELQAVTRAGRRIPLPGGDEFEGAFNKLTMRQNNTSVPLTAAGYTDVFVGSSYVQAVTWVNGQVQARGVLAYSQSSEPGSAYHADQTEQLFAAGKLATLPFSAAEIAAEQVGAVEQVKSAALR